MSFKLNAIERLPSAFFLEKAEQEIQPTGKQYIGKFKDIKPVTALRLTGMQIFSNRRGKYVLAREPPSVFYDPVSSPPPMMHFHYNATMGIVRVYNAGIVTAEIKVR